MIGLSHYLIISAALFSLGIMAVLTRKNAVNVLMGVELILNSANINLVAFSKYSAGNINGQIFAIFVISCFSEIIEECYHRVTDDEVCKLKF